MDLGHPIVRPLKVLIIVQRVIVLIVLKTDIERRIGKRKVDGSVGDFLQPGDTVALMNLSLH